MITYALMVTGWLLVEGELKPLSATAARRGIPNIVFHYELEEMCENDKVAYLDSAASNKDYVVVEADCKPVELPEKPVIQIYREDLHNTG